MGGRQLILTHCVAACSGVTVGKLRDGGIEWVACQDRLLPVPLLLAAEGATAQASRESPMSQVAT